MTASTGLGRGRAARRLATRAFVLTLIVTAPIWAGTGAAGARPLDRGLLSITEQHRFSLSAWMVGATFERATRAPAEMDAASDLASVLGYTRLTRDLQAADALARQIAAAESDEAARRTRLAEVATRQASLLAERERIRPATEAAISAQVEATLSSLGIRERFLSASATGRFPFLAVAVRPGVAFRLGDSPDVLIVSPRDRIQVIGSVLLQPNTDIATAEDLEARTDQLQVSSIVTRTGGLAAYPTMVVPNPSVRELLVAICHEWTHHYLLFTDLGSRYLDSYELRTINETTADIVGRELGDTVYNRYYAGAQPTGAGADVPRSPAPAARSGPSFGELLGAIRLTVDDYLSRGDLAGAEQYMAEQRRALLAQGYYVRKLNPAFLSFYGAYSAGENPFERKLRRLREQSGSLVEFLEGVSTIQQPADLDALLARPR